MKQIIHTTLNLLNKNIVPAHENIKLLLDTIDFTLDEDYLDFMIETNGAYGNISEEQYLILWKIEEVIMSNPYYNDIEECKNLFFVGSNGGNLGYAFLKANGKMTSIDFLDIGERDPEIIADSFSDFLVKISNQKS